MTATRRPRGGDFSRLARVRATLRRRLRRPESLVTIDAYEVALPFAPLRRPPFAVLGDAVITENLASIPRPPIVAYTAVEALALDERGLQESGTARPADGAHLSNGFTRLTAAAVEGCVFQDVHWDPPPEGGFPRAWPLRSGKPAPGDALHPFHVILPSLYPGAPFNFQGLLTFPADKTLFPFQREGVTFLLGRESALLADEMGLGKSIQAITAVRLLCRAQVIQRSLVVCPKSVLTDWSGKFAEWAPELQTTKIQGSAAARRALWARPSHVYLVTYDTLKEDVLDWEDEAATPRTFDLVILDEAQRIKNRSTQTFRAVHRVGGRLRWGLSGTPLENRVEDLTTIFSYLKPGLFRGYAGESPLYVKRAIVPFTLRRTKNAVLKDLPSKTHDKVLLELGAQQQAIYNAAERSGVIALRERGKTATVTHVMALISQLKQICNLDTVSGESCKLEYVEDVLETLEETGEKMVIFSQYPEKTLRLIQPRLQRFQPLLYQGSLTSKQREAVVQRFNEDETVRVLLISLKAGGLGLTLTAANYVVHFDSWWNPATMAQAEDRTHRIGQTKNVFVASLITQGTVEERIQLILEEKRALFKEVVGEISDEGLTRLLNERELFGLFGLQPAKAPSKRPDDVAGSPHPG